MDVLNHHASPEAFLTHLAADLTYDLFKAGAGRLRDAAFGDAEQRALCRVFEHALVTMLREAREEVGDDVTDHVDSLLRAFVGDEEVAGTLLAIALEGRDPSLEALRQRFEAMGFDLETIPVDFGRAIRTLLLGLANELQREAALPSSPLYNRVSLAWASTVRTIVDDTQQAVNSLLTGITTLPTDYAARIKNFMVEYLGTPTQPVPFGGRRAELAELDAWLNSEDSPPYLLLAASAGRGKSALLVRWAQELLSSDRLDVVFIPVSVRFRTNLASRSQRPCSL